MWLFICFVLEPSGGSTYTPSCLFCSGTTQTYLLSALSQTLIDYFFWDYFSLSNENYGLFDYCSSSIKETLKGLSGDNYVHVCIRACTSFGIYLYIFCLRVVSEPTLKWKLKKLISTRPNPLQRKISAPPAVKHRTETLGRVSHASISFDCSFSFSS